MGNDKGDRIKKIGMELACLRKNAGSRRFWNKEIKGTLDVCNEAAGKNGRLRETSRIKEIAWQLPLGPITPITLTGELVLLLLYISAEVLNVE